MWIAWMFLSDRYFFDWSILVYFWDGKCTYVLPYCALLDLLYCESHDEEARDPDYKFLHSRIWLVKAWDIHVPREDGKKSWDQHEILGWCFFVSKIASKHNLLDTPGWKDLNQICHLSGVLSGMQGSLQVNAIKNEHCYKFVCKFQGI